MTDASNDAHHLGTHPLHLGPGATDGAEGRLVSMHTFTGPWSMWEMHPLGSEVVLCTAGTITLHQQAVDGWATAVFITAGLDTQHRPR